MAPRKEDMKTNLFKNHRWLAVPVILLIGLAAPRVQALGLLVSSQDGGSVLQYDRTTGTFIGAFVAAGSGGLANPDGLAYGPDGNLYVLDFSDSSIKRYNGTTGAFIDVFAPSGAGGDGLTLGPDNNFYACDAGPNQVNRFDGTTGALTTFVPNGSGGLSGVGGLIFGPDGNLYVSDHSSDSILRFNGSTGAFIDIFVTAGSGGLSSPQGLAFGADGNLYVSSQGSNQVLRYNGTTGAFIDVFIPTANGNLDQPFGLVFRPDGNLYLSNSATLGTSAILRYNGTTGAFIDSFVPPGSGGQNIFLYFLFAPEGSLQLSAASSSVDENAGSVMITVTRSNGSNGAVTVDFATSDGTATAGTDYSATSGTLAFAEGEVTKTFAIPILDDRQAEGNETVNITLSNPTGGANLGSPSAAVLTINANDASGGGGCSLQRATSLPSLSLGWAFLSFLLIGFLGLRQRANSDR